MRLQAHSRDRQILPLFIPTLSVTLKLVFAQSGSANYGSLHGLVS